ncbi:MAG TPA: diguanylate cyclase [Candidatus Polarisedimenticolia bacterium]|nr:diguanylate cyclase [Candidatus Polarisedimenticolia bacterium]
MDLAGLLRRRRPASSFRADPFERRRLDTVLEAGRYLPIAGPPACRAVVIEAPAIRARILQALQALPEQEAAADTLRPAPVLVALCDMSRGGIGRSAAWMAAAQMAAAAEEEGLAALVVQPPGGLRPPPALSLPPDWSVEALLALGLTAPRADRGEPPPESHRVEAYMAAEPLPRQVPAEGAERQVLLSLMEIASAAAAAEDMDGVLETIARALGRLFPVDGATLGLLEDGDILAREILRRGAAVRREAQRLPADGSHLLGWVITQRRPLWRNDLRSELRFAESLPAGAMRSDMVIPLKARGRVTGAFRVACRRRHAFEPEDFEVLQRCADVTAVAVETQRLLLATRRLSEVDGLTGVSNHRHLLGLLDQEVERARRAELPVSLLMIDIDDFKRVNDTHGHQTGDEVLRHVAQLVSKLLRRSDVVGRYGGEEFAVILPEADGEAALSIGETIRGEVERSPLVLQTLPRGLPVRVSVGVASLPDDAEGAAGLVSEADRGLYQAKRTGKNCVRHVSMSGR